MFSDEITVLTLTPDNPSNTTITSATGEVVYYADTKYSKEGVYTQVHNAKEEMIAFSEWRDVLPDRITIGEKKPVSLGDWMKRSVIPFKKCVVFICGVVGNGILSSPRMQRHLVLGRPRQKIQVERQCSGKVL